MHFSKRLETSKSARILVPFISVLLALLAGSILLLLYGKDPLVVFGEMLNSAFASTYGISETLVKAIPLMLAALAISLAFRMKLWNIGAEGQIYMGAFGASGVALFFGHLSSWILLPLMTAAGMLAGALWAFIPGILRARLQVNETFTSLLLNYVAILWVDYLCYGPWKDPKGSNFPLTPRFPDNATLPTMGDTRIHLGLLVAILLAVALWFLIRSTRWGFEIRVIGESWDAASYAGMNIGRNIVLVMMVSGALAALAGVSEVTGITHRLQHGLSPGYGYSAIIVAWLARLHPLAIIPVAVLFGGLLVGGYSVQTEGVPFSIALIIQGLILFFLLGGEIFVTHRLIWKRQKELRS
ncbi:MAG TPA: ABC transporter permease [Syntrophomonadaceae bacterium]|nr:ABC transporter permease [Syntrophomonadaceae bacterium]